MHACMHACMYVCTDEMYVCMYIHRDMSDGFLGIKIVFSVALVRFTFICFYIYIYICMYRLIR